MAGAKYVFFTGNILHGAVQMSANRGKRFELSLGSLDQQPRAVSESKYLTRTCLQFSGAGSNSPFDISTCGRGLFQKAGNGIGDGQSKQRAQPRNSPRQKCAAARLRRAFSVRLCGAIFFDQLDFLSGKTLERIRSLFARSCAIFGAIMLDLFPGLFEIKAALGAVSQFILLRIPGRVFIIVAGNTTFFWLWIHSACD